MASLAVLLLAVVRVMLQPVLIGGVAGAMAIAREVTPRWPASGLLRQVYDGVLVALIILLFVYVVLRIQTV